MPPSKRAKLAELPSDDEELPSSDGESDTDSSRSDGDSSSSDGDDASQEVHTRTSFSTPSGFSVSAAATV
jgi:hypothetical protein